MDQLELTLTEIDPALSRLPYKERFLHLLKGNLDFHGQNSTYASHAFHSFPAKFPPQLPRLFISTLTGKAGQEKEPGFASLLFGNDLCLGRNIQSAQTREGRDIGGGDLSDARARCRDAVLSG